MKEVIEILMDGEPVNWKTFLRLGILLFTMFLLGVGAGSLLQRCDLPIPTPTLGQLSILGVLYLFSFFIITSIDMKKYGESYKKWQIVIASAISPLIWVAMAIFVFFGYSWAVGGSC